ncbi:Transcription factor TFIIIB component B'' [Cucumispora dikerogammari]|nr:Transcription factor TFIIIB component B'' [Cucumispora dikerogammari]
MDQRLSFFLNNKNFSKPALTKKAQTETANNIATTYDNEDTEIITSATFIGKIKEKKGIKTTRLIIRWSLTETEKFYKLLQLCGTEFTLIEKCFDHKNRKQIKMKLKKELKLNKEKIDEILDSAKFDEVEYAKLLI